MIGWNSRFVPNSKSDMRFKKKIYQRGREIAERDPYELHAKREMKRLEELKRGRSAV
jgi:hypothetical protein